MVVTLRMLRSGRLGGLEMLVWRVLQGARAVNDIGDDTAFYRGLLGICSCASINSTVLMWPLVAFIVSFASRRFETKEA